MRIIKNPSVSPHRIASSRGQHLTRLNFEFAGSFLDVGFVHFKNWRMV
jgi:hypothetical protein